MSRSRTSGHCSTSNHDLTATWAGMRLRLTRLSRLRPPLRPLFWWDANDRNRSGAEIFCTFGRSGLVRIAAFEFRSQERH